MTGADEPIYLDHNATTPVSDEAREAMLPHLGPLFGNPSSAHAQGRRAREAVERARAQVATLLGASAEEIVFTGGGTEANNLAILGAAELAPPGRRHLCTTTIEHPATAVPCAHLEARGFRVTRAAAGGDGRAPIGEVPQGTLLVTVMHSNNETGVLQPVAEAARLARAAGALVHTDAAQSVGKVPIDVRALDVDLLTVAGHKLYAPKGVGALYVRAGVALAPRILGAAHERGLRAGTENVPGIVGLGAACALASRTLAAEAARVEALRDRLHALLRDAIPGLALTGQGAPRLPGTLAVRFPGVSGSALLEACPQVAASAGSACHEGSERPSAVLLAMGLEPREARGAVRLSLGRGTEPAHVEEAAAALACAFARARARAGG